MSHVHVVWAGKSLVNTKTNQVELALSEPVSFSYILPVGLTTFKAQQTVVS